MSQAAATRVPMATMVTGAALRLLALVVGGGIAVGIAVAVGMRPDRIPLLAVTMLLTAVVVGFIAVDRLRPRGQRNLLFMIFSCAYLLLFVLPVFVFYLGDAGYQPDASPNPRPLTPTTVMYGVIAATVAYVALLAGNLLPIGGAVARFLPQMRREWSYETTLVIALVIIPIGWMVRIVNDLGLIPERAGSGVLGAIWYFTEFGIGLLALCYYRYRSRGALVMMALLLVPAIVIGFFGGTKSAVLRPLVMIVIVHIVVTRRLRVWWIVGFFVLMGFFYPISEAYRGYAWSRNLSAFEVLASPQRALRIVGAFGAAGPTNEHMKSGLQATSQRLNGLGILSVIVRDAGRRVPYQWGWTITYIPMSYVPRLLWPGKPKFTTGQWVTDHYGSGPHVRSSTGATWMGELYYNFGWAGILIGMPILGIWMRFLQESLLGDKATIPSLFSGAITIVGLCTAIDADLIAATNSVVFNVTPIILLHLVVCKFTSPPRRLPEPM